MSPITDLSEQSLPQQAIPTPPSDTTATDSTLVTQGIEEFSNTFQKALHFLFSGHWDALYDLLSTGLVQLSGVLLQRGLQALVAFLILFLIYRALDKTLFRLLDRSPSVEPGLQSVLLKTFRVVTLIFIGAIVLDQLGLNVTALIAGLSIAGVIAGFAARDSLENFISGVTILVDQPFRVGDYIEVNDEYGQVDEITLRSTRIRTVQNKVIILPNSKMITEQLVNHTKRNLLRVDIPFGIAYKEKPAEAREILLPLVQDDDRILSDPAPSVVSTSMSDSSVEMAFRFYIGDPSQEVPVRWDYVERVREALREAEIEIPFPHRQLFVDGADAFQGSQLLAPAEEDGGGTTFE